MKGFKVKFPFGNEWERDTVKGTIVSEPYPVIYPQQLEIARNGGTYVGAASTTCVVVLTKDGVLYEDIPVWSIEVLEVTNDNLHL